MQFRSSLITVSSVLVFGVGLVSCGEAQTNSNVAADVQMTGTVQHINLSSKDVNGNAPLTEVLFVSDNLADSPVYLQSSTLTLERFLDDHVVLTGRWTNDKHEILEVLTMEETDTTMNSNSASAKSFSSSDLGLTFTYPSAWQAEELPNGTIEVRDSTQNRLLVSIFNVPANNGETFSRWIARNYPGQTPEEYQVGLFTGQKVKGNNQDILLVNDNASFFSIIFNTEVQGMASSDLQRGYGDIQGSLRFFTSGTSVSPVSGASGAMNSNVSVDAQGSTGAPSNTNGSNGNSNVSSVDNTPPSAIVQYVIGNASSVVGAGASVAEVEVAGANHVYVTYTENGVKKKVLLEYKASGSGYTTAPLASFEAGENTTWVKTSGNNVAANEPREIYKVEGTGATKTAEVQKGKTLYNNTQLNFQAQYPRSWYFNSQSISNEGGLQKVTFSDKPLDESPSQQVELKVYPKGGMDLSKATKTTVAGKEGYIIKDASGAEQLAVQGSDGRVYVSNSVQDNSNKQVIEDIMGSITTK